MPFPLIPAGTKAGGYTIAKSLRFRSSASAYLSRTSGTSTDQKTATLSFWMKSAPSISSTTQIALWASTSNNTLVAWNTTSYTGKMFIRVDGTNDILYPMMFRDPSAWYHIVVAVDTAQATAANRVKLYVNGVLQTASSGTATQNSTNFNASSTVFNIGKDMGNSWYWDGYVADYYFIDGQALDPTYFGQTDTATGVWMPKAYTGSYGTNGFYLKFADASAATAAAIGKDSSPNGNNWTPNNISVTAGVTYDSMYDTPTNYDNGVTGAGNYAVLNPLDKGSIITLSAGNLTCDYSGTATDACAFSTIAFDAGSTNFYAEFTLTAISLASNDVAAVGIADVNTVPSASISTSGTSVLYLDSGSKVVNGTTTAFGASWTTNDVIGVYVNQGTITFYKNGTSQGNAATGVSGTYKFVIRGRSGVSRTFTIAANFGQRTYSNTPSGAKALNTFNLPTPTIGATSSTLANKYFDINLYTGTGSAQSITNSGGFQPDFVWIKDRSFAATHNIFDVLRGVRNHIESNTTNAETTEAAGVSLTAFNSNGFSLGTDNAGAGRVNFNGDTFVGWQWKANGSGTLNQQGSVNSTVSANVTAGFSVVTYTGTSTTGTVGHGLGVAPKMIIVKTRNAVADWYVYHASNGANKYMYMNLTNAVISNAGYFDTVSSTVFGGTSAAGIISTSNFVAYCFAEVAGYSKFGSYTGNGSTDGPMVWCGFRPRYILSKRTDTVEDWVIYDTARETYNVESQYLYANTSAAEPGGATARIDILSNGFKLRNSGQSNASGGTYIFMAVAENPFNYARAR